MPRGGSLAVYSLSIVLPFYGYATNGEDYDDDNPTQFTGPVCENPDLDKMICSFDFVINCLELSETNYDILQCMNKIENKLVNFNHFVGDLDKLEASREELHEESRQCAEEPYIDYFVLTNWVKWFMSFMANKEESSEYTFKDCLAGVFKKMQDFLVDETGCRTPSSQFCSAIMEPEDWS